MAGNQVYQEYNQVYQEYTCVSYLTCNYRQAGPSRLRDGSNAEAGCPKGDTPLGKVCWKGITLQGVRSSVSGRLTF